MNQLRRDEADAAWLRFRRRPPRGNDWPTLNIADLFCGCGGMTLGLEEAARKNRYRIEVKLAVDSDPDACAVYQSNFPTAYVLSEDLSSLFGGKVGTELSRSETSLAERVGDLSVLLGAAPCQGHSDLNNHTRRNDPKNGLYVLMARAAEVLRPKILIIENVSTVECDSKKVVDVTRKLLEELGYIVAGAVVDLVNAGIPQRRKRHLLIAAILETIDPTKVLETISKTDDRPRDVRWAINDLTKWSTNGQVNTPSNMSTDNIRRVDYLFDNDVYDLPNSERPPCHRDEHSYISMYGRLKWDRPAQTITTGFTSMGQGRFVHPSKRRTLTPHEAARLQTFPDWFDWGDAGRTALSTMIGNAVPPLMMVRLGNLLIPGLIADNDDSPSQISQTVLPSGKRSHEGGSPAGN